MNIISIGDIVTYNNHPFSSSFLNVTISGEHLMTPPLMLVAEILTVTKNEYSETDGTRLAIENSSNCKCLWFSSKNHQFEEAWFSSSQLKTIVFNLDKIEDPKKLVDKLVSLKTLRLETGKRKSSITYDNNEISGVGKVAVNSLLTFVPPIMQVIEVKINEDKEKKFDPKSGKQKRFVSKYNVKCKWFNPSGEKFSERILPFEILTIIPDVPDAKFLLIQEFIDKGAILKMGNTLLRPISISCNSGFYSLSGFDFVLNKIVSVPFDDKIVLDLEKDLYLLEAPDFQLIKTSPTKEWANLNTIEDVVVDSMKNNIYLTIKYKNREDKITTRTLSKIATHSTKEKIDDTGTAVDVVYIEAYCHLRQEVRFFRLDRVIHSKQLNLKY